VSSGRPIVLGISGGIAAYKTPFLIRLLQKNGFDVKAVCTAAARRFVTQQVLFTLTGHPVYSDEPLLETGVEHVALAQWAEYLLICPTTANTLAKIAYGIADNLLSTLALSFQNRLIVAPAMNAEMWKNAATQENISLLRRRNVHVLPVEEGQLACGDSGPGRMLSPESIVDAVLSLSSQQCLGNKKVLISSGPTFELIDPVRVLCNLSTGKMGAALAFAAMLSGAQVTMVTGPAVTPPPPGVRIVRVTSAIEMLEAMEKEFLDADICIMAAAVSDYRPKNMLKEKMQCDRNGEWNLSLIPNPDIAERLGNQKKDQFLVCFSLETGNDAGRPVSKMKKKNCDMMVVNRADLSLALDSATVTLLYPDNSSESLPMQSKREIARRIIERIAAKSGIHHG
jgi:phosphopantothenoylcysteine decarboxylase / phosphopantothenate---cysteine ligase